MYSDGIAKVVVGPGHENTVDLRVVRQLGPMGLLGFKPDYTLIFSLRVDYVRPGQPAERAGLEVGDVITSVDGADVESLGRSGADLLIRDRSPGTLAHLGVLHRGNVLLKDLIVGKWQ